MIRFTAVLLFVLMAVFAVSLVGAEHRNTEANWCFADYGPPTLALASSITRQAGTPPMHMARLLR